jgi:CheY-like chemotaxis protein
MRILIADDDTASRGKEMTTLEQQDSDPTLTYPIVCYSCDSPFDALAAHWCDCLSSERTRVCPGCDHCFRGAPRDYRRQFWEEAPQALWKLRMAKHLLEFETPPNPEPEAAPHPLVLIAEDDKDIQRMAYHHATNLGYGVILARNGIEAFEHAIRYRPELVLTDALMPGLDGRELCLRLKQNPATAATRVVVMTSLYTKEVDRREALSHFRADDHLAKPIDAELLTAVLKRYLGPPGRSIPKPDPSMGERA